MIMITILITAGCESCTPALGSEKCDATANLRTEIMDFRGFDSSRILMLRGGIPRPIGDFPESVSQAILVGIILVGRLGVDSRYGQSADWEAAD